MAKLPEKIGKYKVQTVLGWGSMAVVYHAVDPFMKRDVALKVAHPHLANDGEDGTKFKNLFFNEARAAGILNHPSILKVYDADIDSDHCYLVMEYVEHASTLETSCRAESLPPIHESINIIYQAAKALDYAHRQGIIHRDIKPSNMLLNRDRYIKLSDFGIALVTTECHIHATQPAGFVGSPLYMSPEQINESEIQPNTDVFSLGIVAYQLLTGQHPFMAKNISAVCTKIIHEKHRSLKEYNRDIPEELDALLDKMLEKDPENRYRMVIDLASDLASIFEGLDKVDTVDPDRRKFEYVARLAFFENFTEDELWDLVRVCPFEKYSPGQAIIREGEREKSVFILISGIANVEKRGSHLGIIMEGDCFGEMGYFSNIERTATVTAKTDIIVMKVNSENISAARAETQLRFNNVFLQTVIARLADASSKLVNLKEIHATEYLQFGLK